MVLEERMKYTLVFGVILLASNVDLKSRAHAEQDRPGSSMAASVAHTACFVGRADELDLLRPPVPAESLFIAKVRVVSGPFWLLGRHGEVLTPTKDVLGATLKVEAVVRGTVVIGAEYIVSFADRGIVRRCKYPSTPDQKKREYFVAGYIDEDGKYRLLEVPISKLLYDQWEREVLAYQHERERQGARQ
jgi:hypothetical protein